MVGNLFDVDLGRFTQETILPVGDHRNKNNDFHNKRVYYSTRAFLLSICFARCTECIYSPVCIFLLSKKYFEYVSSMFSCFTYFLSTVFFIVLNII